MKLDKNPFKPAPVPLSFSLFFFFLLLLPSFPATELLAFAKHV